MKTLIDPLHTAKRNRDAEVMQSRARFQVIKVHYYGYHYYLHSKNHWRIWSCIFSFMSGPSTSLSLSLMVTNACWNSRSCSVCVTLRLPSVRSARTVGANLGLLGGGGGFYQFDNNNNNNNNYFSKIQINGTDQNKETNLRIGRVIP